MKNIFLLSLLCIILFSACKSDDDATPFSNGLYHWDGENNNAPSLEPGEHEAAARFPASLLSDAKGKSIKEVRYWMAFTPASARIKIYSSNGGNQPGTLLYSADVTNGIKDMSWNTHNVTREIEIGDEDIWVAVALTHDIAMQSIGCDPGPARPNGDWLFQDTDNEWKLYNERTPVSINWNIRMKVE